MKESPIRNNNANLRHETQERFPRVCAAKLVGEWDHSLQEKRHE